MNGLAMIAQSAPSLTILVGAASFVLVLSMWLAGMILLKRSQAGHDVVKERLGLGGSPGTRTLTLRLWHEGQEATTAVPAGRRRRSLTSYMDALCQQAGWHVPGLTVLLALAGAALLAFAVTFMASPHVLAGLSAALGVVLLFWAWFKRRVHRRGVLFEAQFVEAIDLAVRSLRAGHPLIGACRLVAEENPPPIGPIFAEICQNQEMGMPLEAALRQAADRSDSEDMKLFATSVAIQLRSGGNTADMMERLARVVRERIRLARRVRVLTAQTQFSKRILVALPLVMFAVLNLVNPAYIEPLYTTWTGQMLLVAAGAGVLGGMYTMNRMARLRY